MAKQYGLIIPNKTKLTPANIIKKPSIFEEESDSDEEIEKPTGLPSTEKRQDRITREKAIEEDPTVYQYDEVYDQMEQEKKDLKLLSKDSDKKPKYISRLLAAAEKRKQENERRIERQVQKEREAEGDEFKDKESFVTTAYRRKLEELKKQEEEEKREEYLESIGDVKKQGNLDGFYRHLYDQKVNYTEKLNSQNVNINELTLSAETASADCDTSSNKAKISSTKVSKKPLQQKRVYRKRESSESDELQDIDEKKLEHLPSNIDADSDFSIDSDSEESENESKHKKPKLEEKISEELKPDCSKPELDNSEIKIEKEEEKEESETHKIEIKPKRPKIDIWKKRTIGSVFDEAVQRYYLRKAIREAAK